MTTRDHTRGHQLGGTRIARSGGISGGPWGTTSGAHKRGHT